MDLPHIVKEVEAMTVGVKNNLKLAVMGCIVNGPGEAKDADLGIAFGKDKAALFLKGSVLKRVTKDIIIDEFREELNVRQNEELRKLERLVLKVVAKIAETEKYDLIIHQGAIFASNRIDITDKVLAALGKASVED